MFSVQKVHSIYPDYIDHLPTRKIEFTVLVHPTEHQLSLEKYIEKRVNSYVYRASEHGFIIRIKDIVKVSSGIITNNGNAIKYKVCANCHVFDPSVGDIIVGAKLMKIMDIGLHFEYANVVAISVENRGNLKIDDYKVGNLYNIEIKSINYSINESLYRITYNKTISMRKKKYNKTLHLDVKKITLGLEEAYEWIGSNKAEFKDKILSAIDYDDVHHTINISSIRNISKKCHMYIQGSLHYIYKIPIQLRKMTWSADPLKDPTNRVITSTSTDNYPEDTQFKQIVDTSLYENQKYESSWNNTVRYLINPFEMLHPAKRYHRQTSKKQVSRAYFKVPEIMKVFSIDISTKDTVFAMADAPGGWSQAFSHLYDINIITTSLNVRGAIKYHKSIKALKNVTIDNLAAGDGNLLKMENIQYLNDKYKALFSVVGADGAIAYETPPKELYHNKLFLIESIIAILTLKPTGSAFIKLYKRKASITQQIIYYISTFFESAHLYKPKSVRVANAETFLVLTNFRGINSELRTSLLEMAKEVLEAKDRIDNILSESIPEEIKDILDQYNDITESIETQTHALGYEMINRYRTFPIHNKHQYIKVQQEYSKKFP